MEETKKISLWEQFYISCTKPSEYKKLLNVSKWKVALFVVILGLMLTILGTVLDIVGLGISIGGPRNFVENRLPKFELKDGVLKADSDIDFTMLGVHFVMDTNKDKVSDDDLSQESSVEVQFAKNELVAVNQVMGQKFHIQFKDYKNAVVTNHTLVQYIPLVYIMLAFLVVFTFFFSMLAYLFYCVCLAWLAKFNLLARGQQETFGRVFQLAIYARVPCQLIGTIGSLVGATIFDTTAWWAISYIATYELILFAFREKKPKEA